MSNHDAGSELAKKFWGIELKSKSVSNAKERLQNAWDQCQSLPPIVFTEDEAAHLVDAILSKEPTHDQ